MENPAYFRNSKQFGLNCSKKMRKVLLAVFVFLLSLIFLNLLIAEPLESLAEKRVSAAAAKLLNDSLKEVMQEYDKEGGGAFAKGQSSAGEGSVLFIDAVGMNLMAARVTERAQQKVEELGICGIEVPLGSACGLPILNGIGPRLKIGIEPIGEVSGSFSSRFEDAGVNQTRYRADLRLNANIEMLILGKARSVSASVSAPVCETIVVGGVPAAYTNVDGMDDALNLIPTDVGGIFDP